jgi:uncharacterized protein YndB with AHSA1/START domain
MSETSHIIINKQMTINAPAAKVWKILTEPALMKDWVSDSDIDVFVDGQAGGSILFKGSLHGMDYEDRGRILAFDPEQKFQYSHLSKISELPDIPENYSVVTFLLNSRGATTEVTLRQENFVTWTIFKHWEFYWNTTLKLIKDLCEKNG